MLEAALDPGAVVAIVTVAAIAASALIFRWLSSALGAWRDSVGRPPASADVPLREEVRQLVVAANARRVRRGEQPLDVDEEVERKLRDLEGLDR